MNVAVRNGRSKVFPPQSRRAQTDPEANGGAAGGIASIWHHKAYLIIALPLNERPQLVGDARTMATMQLRKLIERWVDDEDVRGEIGSIEERSADGEVTIRCSSRVKRRLRRHLKGAERQSARIAATA
ncbi:MAG: hypothetical protein Q7S02_03910 [bacterium]|nr:hypothetical protein [bacterium]